MSSPQSVPTSTLIARLTAGRAWALRDIGDHGVALGLLAQVGSMRQSGCVVTRRLHSYLDDWIAGIGSVEDFVELAVDCELFVSRGQNPRAPFDGRVYAWSAPTWKTLRPLVVGLCEPPADSRWSSPEELATQACSHLRWNLNHFRRVGTPVDGVWHDDAWDTMRRWCLLYAMRKYCQASAKEVAAYMNVSQGLVHSAFRRMRDLLEDRATEDAFRYGRLWDLRAFLFALSRLARSADR